VGMSEGAMVLYVLLAIGVVTAGIVALVIWATGGF